MVRMGAVFLQTVSRGFASMVLMVAALSWASEASADTVTMATALMAAQDGDLIFQESRSAQSAALQAATGSRYTHVGIVFSPHQGEPFVIEAVQQVVHKTPLAVWIRRGKDAHFVLMRLRHRPDHGQTGELRREA